MPPSSKTAHLGQPGAAGSPLSQSLAKTETKASLNKDSSKPNPVSWCHCVRLCWDVGTFFLAFAESFFEVNPSKQEPSNPGMVLWKTPSSSVALGAARGSAGVLAGAPARTAAPAGRGMRGLQLGPMSRAEALPRGRGACVGARRPASGASALGPQQGLECLVCLGINRNGGSLVVQPHFLEAFALDSAQHRGSARGAF